MKLETSDSRSNTRIQKHCLLCLRDPVIRFTLANQLSRSGFSIKTISRRDLERKVDCSFYELVVIDFLPTEDIIRQFFLPLQKSKPPSASEQTQFIVIRDEMMKTEQALGFSMKVIPKESATETVLSNL